MTEESAAAERRSAQRLRDVLRSTVSLSRAQAVAGFVAAMLSTVASVVGYNSAARIPQTGDMVTYVVDGSTQQPVSDAIVEVLTQRDALVTTFPTLEKRGARRSLKEGMYRVRVIHPRFAPDSRLVAVVAGQTSEIRFGLSPRFGAVPATPVSPAPPPTPAASPTTVAPPPPSARIRPAVPTTRGAAKRREPRHATTRPHIAEPESPRSPRQSQY